MSESKLESAETIVDSAADELQDTADSLAEQVSVKTKRKGPNPWVVIVIALGVGILVAKIVDWRGHAHPR